MCVLCILCVVFGLYVDCVSSGFCVYCKRVVYELSVF